MPDTHELEALVRATRPVPDPAWAARLDRRAAAFPDRRPWYAWLAGRLRGNLVPLGALATAIVLVTAAGIAVHGGGRDDSASVSSRAGSEKSAGDSASSSAGSAKAPALAAPSTAVAPGAGTAARAVRRSAELTLSTRPADVERVSDRVIHVADALGGFVASSSVSSGGEGAGAQLTLKVPSERLAQALSQLSGLAHVASRSQAAEDVTDQRAVLRASVTDARAERDGLRRRLARAETDAERARLRGELQRAEQLVVSRRRRLAALAREVSLATVGVEIDGDRRGAGAPPGGRWTPGDALHDAGRVLEVTAGVTLVALAVLVPLALLGGLAGATGRIVVRRRRERALEPA